MPDVFKCGLIGMGPAGIGLAMSLRGTSTIKNMICFERGSFNIDVNCSALSEKECCCSNSCGVISGVGGASTLSSGKISNFPAGSGLAEFFDSEKQLRELLDEVIQFLSDEIQLKRIEIDTATKMNAKAFYKQRNIDYKYYDVYEFDGKSYRSFIQRTVQELMDEGLQLFDNAEVLDVHRDPHTSYFCINVRTPDGEKQFFVQKLVVAIGALDIRDTDLSASISLIALLWEYQHQGGALSQKMITSMIDCGVLLRNADPEMINGASYDLRLGDEYYYDGKIQKLSDEKPFLTIEPYDYAIVSCKETAWIPRDVIAKFGLTVGLFCQGVILSNGPQIDPGFRGTLFCLLFNTSNRAVHLKRGKHYATIEFNKLIGYAKPYEGKYQGKERIIEYIPENALHGAINELKKEVEHLKTESRIMQNIYLGVVALMFAIISILLVLK